MTKYFIILILFSVYISNAYTQNTENFETDPVLSSKAKELYKELRCLVCQNQSLSESDAPLALDLRSLIKEKLENGSSKEEIKKHLVERYGEFILLQPTFSFKNLFLWMGPLIFLLLGIMFAYRFYSSSDENKDKNKNLSEVEAKKVQRILDERIK